MSRVFSILRKYGTQFQTQVPGKDFHLKAKRIILGFSGKFIVCNKRNNMYWKSYSSSNFLNSNKLCYTKIAFSYFWSAKRHKNGINEQWSHRQYPHGCTAEWRLLMMKNVSCGFCNFMEILIIIINFRCTIIRHLADRIFNFHGLLIRIYYYVYSLISLKRTDLCSSYTGKGAWCVTLWCVCFVFTKSGGWLKVL